MGDVILMKLTGPPLRIGYWELEKGGIVIAIIVCGFSVAVMLFMLAMETGTIEGDSVP